MNNSFNSFNKVLMQGRIVKVSKLINVPTKNKEGEDCTFPVLNVKIGIKNQYNAEESWFDVAMFHQLALTWAGQLNVNDFVSLEGRLQQRKLKVFDKNTDTPTPAYQYRNNLEIRAHKFAVLKDKPFSPVATSVLNSEQIKQLKTDSIAETVAEDTEN